MPETNAGVLYGINFNPGMSMQDQLVSTGYSQAAYQPLGSNVDTASQSAQAAAPVGAIWFLFGFIAIIFLAKFLSEREGSSINPSLMGFGLFNLVAVSLMAIPGIAVTKIIVNKYPVKGLTDLVNIV